jgi:hypothetical protein
MKIYFISNNLDYIPQREKDFLPLALNFTGYRGKEQHNSIFIKK